MRNWTVDEARMRKYPKKHKLWRLEQLLSYGLDKGEKISRNDVIKNWTKLKDRLDPRRRETIKYLLWS